MYLVDRVYQRTVAELLARPGRFWTVFAPFARDASPLTVPGAVQAARERAQSQEEFVDLAAAMAVMAAGSAYADDLREWIMSTLGNDFVERSLLWQRALGKGRKEGREEGREEGRLATLRSSLLTVLAARGLRVTDAQRARIAAASDSAAIEAWLEAAVPAKTTGEALRATPHAAKG